jgi:membrane protease YdiL (CAAX protease family)
MLALVLAAWLFQREEVILAEERGIPLSLRRNEFLPRDYPTPALSLGLFALVMLLIFYIATYAQQRAVLPGLLLTEWLLVLLPVCSVLWWTRVRLRSALFLAAPTALSLGGAILAASGAIILMLALNAWHNRILPVPEEFAHEFAKLFAVGETPQGLTFLLFVLAVSPAICEEALFRGALLSGLRQRMPPWAAVLFTAFLFGCFHLSIYRVVPTAILGALLGYITLRGRSIVPAMAAHFINNAAAVLLATNRVPPWLVDMEKLETEGVGGPVLAVAALLFWAGIACTEFNAARCKADPRGSLR